MLTLHSSIIYMNILRITIYCILLLIICSLTYSLATSYQVNASRNQVSFVIWTIDMIDLFIHETGHLIFSIFGRFIGFLGGSLFQVIIPVVAVIVFGRSSLKSIPFTFYWTGQSMINVSIYIGDAPYQHLKLISRGAIHDWRWILNHVGMMDYAGDLAFIINTMGLLMCCVGIAIGIYIVIKDCINLSSPAS
jgi:hypothetical protein